jgi:hypothetical protein
MKTAGSSETTVTLYVTTRHRHNAAFFRSTVTWPAWCSQYGDWLRARKGRSLISSPWRVKTFLFSIAGAHSPTHWVPEDIRKGKVAGAWSWPLTSYYCWDQENSHSPGHLHGVMLSTGITYLYLYLLLCVTSWSEKLRRITIYYILSNISSSVDTASWNILKSKDHKWAISKSVYTPEP